SGSERTDATAFNERRTMPAMPIVRSHGLRPLTELRHTPIRPATDMSRSKGNTGSRYDMRIGHALDMNIALAELTTIPLLQKLLFSQFIKYEFACPLIPLIGEVRVIGIEIILQARCVRSKSRVNVEDGNGKGRADAQHLFAN